MRQLLYHITFIFSGIFCSLPLVGQEVDSLQVAEYQAIATAAWNEEDYSKAAQFQKKLLRIYQEQNEVDSAFQQTYKLVRTYYYRNELDSTKYYLDLPKRQNWLQQISPQHINLNNYWNLWGVYAYVMGDYATAGNYFEKILATELTADSLDHQAIVGSFNNLGVIYDEVGDYTKSMYYLEQGLQFRKDSLQDYIHLNTVELLNTLAYEFYVFKDYTKADSLYQDAFSILQQLPSSKKYNSLFTKLCRNISLSQVKQNQPDVAIEWLNRSLVNIAQNNGSTVTSAMAYDLLGYALLHKKQYAQAIDNLNKSLDLFKQIRPAKHPRIAALYRDLGEVHTQQGEYNTALSYYQKALTALVYDFNDSTHVQQNPRLDQSINSRIELLKVLQGKAEILPLVEQSEAALATYQLASALLDSIRINYIAEGSKYVLLEQATAIYEGAIQTALDVNRLDLAWEWAERSKAVLLLENLKKIQAAEFAHLPDSLLQQERDFKVEIAYEERQLFSAQRKNEDAVVDSLREKLFYLRHDYQQFLEQLERDNPRYYQLKYDTKVASLQEIQAELLTEDDVLLEYFMGEERLYCFIITKNKIEYTSTSNPHQTIQQDIQQLNTIISRPHTAPSDYSKFTKLAHELYEQLIDITDTYSIQAHPYHLIIIPSAELSYLPFGVLLEHPLAVPSTATPRYDTLSYLIKKHPISYGFSSTLLLENQRTQNVDNQVSFAAFAPVFDGAASQNRSAHHLGKLSNSIREVETINQYWEGNLYLRQMADKATFLDQLHQYNILHLATHATLNDNEPNDSRIYFHDDYLTTTEIYNLPLQADLVILSACETGTGALQRGEGLISLARSFAYANCPSLVTSLWQVDDQVTADLMIDFHQHLAKAQPKDVALQQAQVNYLNHPLLSAEMKHPYYWAAFVQIGETAVVVPTQQNWWWIVIGLVSIFMILYLMKYRNH